MNLQFALRTMRRSPAFTTVAIASLALGIGANAAIFSFVNAILLKRLPVPEPTRLVTFAETYRGETVGKVWNMGTIYRLSKSDPAFAGVFGWFPRAVNFSIGDTAEPALAELVTGEYFDTLQVKPAVGRLFTGEDIQNAAANPVCVLSYALWQRQFGGSRDVVGRTVLLNSHPYRVLGVTARGFYGAELQHRADLQIPATRLGDFMPAFAGPAGMNWLKNLSWLSPMARLKPGISRSEAQAQTLRLLRQPGHEKEDLHLEDASQGFHAMRSAFGRPVLVLMSVAALVLLIACANLANLLLARAQKRAKEFAVRLSVGASRSNLIRQLLLESVLLAACGGAAGILLSFWINRTLLAFFNTGRSALSALHVVPDGKVFAFSIALSFATAILFGLMPAWQATRPELLPELNEATTARGFLSRMAWRRALVIAQIAFSLIVVFAAGLLTRTLRALETIDLGFKPDRVLALNVDPAAVGDSNAQALRIEDQILSRARKLPGVSAASLAAGTLGGSISLSMNVDVPGYTPKGRGDDVAEFASVSPGYFKTLDQPLVRGRDFTERDGQNAPRVAIVNQKFVRHYLNGQNPLGRKFSQNGEAVEIVGIAADARGSNVRSGPEETVYIPEKQGPASQLTLLVRAKSNPEKLVPSLLAIVRSIDRHMPVSSIETLESEIEAGLSSERILGYLSSLFAALAALLAGIGLYGVLAWSVARRTREIGVRFAVGAQPRDITYLFARESAALILAGLFIGAPCALASMRALRALLFGITTADPLTLFLSICLLAASALLAIALPLWRAARVNPLAALRHE